MILEKNQILNFLYNAGFKGANLQAAIKICFCESGFNTNAHNTSGEDSRGLMQINVDAHPEYLNLNLFDPQINANVAYNIFTETGNFQAWTCARKLGLVNPTNIFYGTALVFIGIALYIRVAQ
jgi:hypothetical protein